MQMHHQPAVVAGVEDQIGVTRRDRRLNKVVSIDLTNAERVFLRHGLLDVGAAMYAIMNNTKGNIVVPWDRGQVHAGITRMRDELSRGALVLLIIKPLDYRVVTHAIEGNPYFADMRDDDYRLTVAQVRAAEALRRKVSIALGRPIGRVPLGEGRDRLQGVS